MVTGTHLNSIARSDNYLIGGVLWTHPATFHDGHDYDDDGIMVNMIGWWSMIMMIMIGW